MLFLPIVGEESVASRWPSFQLDPNRDVMDTALPGSPETWAPALDLSNLQHNLELVIALSAAKKMFLPVTRSAPPPPNGTNLRSCRLSPWWSSGRLFLFLSFFFFLLCNSIFKMILCVCVSFCFITK